MINYNMDLIDTRGKRLDRNNRRSEDDNKIETSRPSCSVIKSINCPSEG